MSHLLRIELPDVPGSLGAVATAIGLVGANIEAIEIVEHRQDGTAVDDVFVELLPGVMPDMIVSAVQRLDSVRVLWISRYAVGGNLSLDLEAVETITADPRRAAYHLTELLPRAFRSDWAMVAELDHGLLTRSHASAGAPDLPDQAKDWFPLDEASRLVADSGWAGWNGTEVAAAPLGTSDRIIVFGRRGGPEILDSEMARLNHLAGLTASIEGTTTH